MIKRIGLLIIGLFVGLNTQAQYKVLPDEIRQEYLPLVDEMCHSFMLNEIAAGGHVLDAEYPVVREKYHEVMACVFETAIVDATNEMNEEFREIFAVLGTGYDPKDRELKGPCGAYHYETAVYKVQKDLGYKTLCIREDNEEALVNKLYSACHVSEIALNEYCGYQEYLKWKPLDRSIEAEFKILMKGIPQESGDSQGYRGGQFAIMEVENERSLRTLESTLKQYHEFEQAYRLHLWKVVLVESLKLIQEKSSIVRNAMERWFPKFYDAASKLADQRPQ